MLYVGIDLGTYLCRFILAKKRNAWFDTLNYKTFVINFGQAKPGFAITKDAMYRLEKSFKTVAEQIAKYSEKYPAQDIRLRCVATAALRFSSKAEEVINSIYDQFNIPVEIITAQEEIYLAALGCVQHIKNEAIIIDVGSGSTEIGLVIKKNGAIEIKDYISLNLGLVNNLSAAEIRTTELDKLRKFVSEHKNLPVIFAKCNTLNIVYTVFNKAQKKQGSIVLSLQTLEKAIKKFTHYTNETLKQDKNIGVRKFRLIKIGLPWIYTLLKIINCKEIVVAQEGLKEGIIMGLMKNDRDLVNEA